MIKIYDDKLGDRMIKQLLNSVIAKYRDLSVSRRSQYFAQPHPIIIIVNYCELIHNYCELFYKVTWYVYHTEFDFL